VGRADWRPSVTVDPMVIESPENCRDGIAGGKTRDLQVHKVAADCTTTKRRRNDEPTENNPDPHPPSAGLPTLSLSNNCHF
jgi:hypothetical protein